MFNETLKQTTAPFHTLSEDINFSKQLSEGTISTEEYATLLRRLLHLYRQASICENQYTPISGISNSFFAHKVTLLQKDLGDMHDTNYDHVEIFEDIPPHEWLGFAYVAAGSLLGGQYISKKLEQKNLEEKDLFPTNFYASCADSARSIWKPFLEQLNKLDDIQQAAVLRGAKTCYLFFIYVSTVINKEAVPVC